MDCVRAGMSPRSTGDGPDGGRTANDTAETACASAGVAHAMDIVGSACSGTNGENQIQSQYGWPLSPLSSAPSTSAAAAAALASPSQVLAQWPVPADTLGTLPAATERGGIEEASTVASDQDASIDPSFLTTSSRLSRSEAASTRPTTPALSTRYSGEHSRSKQALRTLIHHDLAKARHLLQIFFAEIHPHWPILHVPTFEVGNASELLLGAMLMLSKWVAGRQDHSEMAFIVFREVTAASGPVRAVPWDSNKMDE